MGGKSGGKVKIAEYSLSLHLGMCLSGAGLALVAVRYGGKEFWRNAGATARTAFGIVKTDLFGGDEKEGGLKGMMWFLPGAADQRLPAAIYRRLGYEQDTHPGFRGIASLFFHGTTDEVTPPAGTPGEMAGYADLRADTHNRKSKVAGRAGFYWCANNPYLKKLGARMRRPSIGLNPSLAMIRIEDDSNGNAQYAANPAHMLYECIVSAEFGSGEDPANVDIASFNAAARTFYDEGLGLSVLWDRRGPVEEFSADIQRHVNAVQYVDPTTGRYTLQPLRRDYDIDTLVEINPSNATITQFRRRTWAECPNEVVVTFTVSETGKSGSVTVQDLAAIAAQGARISVSKAYPMVSSRVVATKLAERDLAQEVAPLMGCQVTVTRGFWEATPSHVYKLRWPRYGIQEVVCRVLSVDRGEDTVTLQLVEDIFGADVSSYAAVGGTQWQSPNRPPRAATLYRTGTAPAFMVAEALGLTSPADIEVGDAMAAVYVGADGPGQIGFELMTAMVDVSGAAAVDTLGQKPLTSSWVTLAALPAEAQSTLTSFPGLRGAAPSAGDFILIGAGGDAETEIALVRAVNNQGTVLNRGVLDTVPRAWAAGTRMWCVSPDLAVADETVRAEGEVARYWFLPQTPGGVLDLDSAPEVSVALSNRARRPNRPANVRVNGQGFGVVDATAASTLAITWATRNRTVESSQVLGWTDASVAGESGQTTTVRALGPGGNVISSATGLTGTSHNMPVSGIGGARFIEVAAVRGGLESLQSHRLEVLLSASDATATNAATLLAALNAVPMNTGSRYVIGLAGGNYGDFTFPTNYDRGTTLVQIVSLNRASKARFTSISAPNARNIEILGLEFRRDTILDEFGYPNGTILDLNGARGTGAHRLRVQDCDFRGGTFQLVARNLKQADIVYNNFIAPSVDSLRPVANTDGEEVNNVLIGHNRFTALHPTINWPDLRSQLGYEHLLNDSTDPRRSDQRSGDYTVPNLAGTPVMVSDATRKGRHADFIQGWGRWVNVSIEDNDFETGNCYRQCILAATTSNYSASYSTGVAIRRNRFLGAHAHGFYPRRHIDPILEQNLFRRRADATWALHYSDSADVNLMRIGVSVRNLGEDGTQPGTRAQLVNNVFPAQVANYWMQPAWYTNLGSVFSDTAVPVGWASTDVALGRTGPYGYEA